MNHSDSTRILALQAFLLSRQEEILSSISRLVECESPSGDFAGSRAVVDMLAETVRTIPAINAVERISVPGYGEHLRVKIFDGQSDDALTTLVLGHTDTVHP